MTLRRRCAEFVFPGHPDKLSDAIADALVQEAARLDRRAFAGLEVAVDRDQVFVTGCIACEGAESIDVEARVREVYASAGYGADWSPRPEALGIRRSLRLDSLGREGKESRAFSDDQSICTGYAVQIPQTNCLPFEHWLAARLGRRLMRLRREIEELSLGPDGKVMVTVEERKRSRRVLAFHCALQQKMQADEIGLMREVRAALREELGRLAEVFPDLVPDLPEELSVIGGSSFHVGGPESDNGLSGKKLAIDAYGPHVPIGGGALSGKDFFKVDRAGALHARRLAKAVVMTGAARRALVHLTWRPGDHRARLPSIQGENGKRLDPAPWEGLFDLSLEASGGQWAGVADLVEVARFGHFMQESLPWEQLRFSSDAPKLQEPPDPLHDNPENES